MEVWSGLSYDAIMQMPVTRRHRLMLQKSNLEQKRAQDHKTAMAQARARSRSRRG